MASIKLLIRGKKNPTSLYLRFTNGREYDLWAKTNVLLNPEHWDQKNEKLRNLAEITNRDTLNAKYSRLKAHVIEKHNEAYGNGVIIDKKWLETAVNEFFKRPLQEENRKIPSHFVYYIDFAEWWLEEKAPKWKTSKNKFLNNRAIQQYESFLKIFRKFQADERIKIVEVGNEMISDFISFMEDDENYAPLTVKRHLGRLRFFLNRAIKLNIKVDLSFNERTFISQEDNIQEPYLSEDEIQRIYELDLAHDDYLDHIRDNFIIGLWTALRISDFNHALNIEHIKDGFIDIKTTKTGEWTTIPLHPHVKAILAKRFYQLPRKVSDPKFNIGIKTICMLCNIDAPIKGKLFDSITKRNKIGIFPKWKLVSSHICRRSFCSNLFGKVPNSVIQSIGAWKTEDMMLHYMKRTKRESAQILKKHWDEQK